MIVCKISFCNANQVNYIRNNWSGTNRLLLQLKYWCNALIYLFNISHIYINLNKKVHFSTSCLSSVLIMSWESFFVLIVCWKISSVLNFSLTNFSSHAGVQACRWLPTTVRAGLGFSHALTLSLPPAGSEVWSWDLELRLWMFLYIFQCALIWRDSI